MTIRSQVIVDSPVRHPVSLQVWPQVNYVVLLSTWTHAGKPVHDQVFTNVYRNIRFRLSQIASGVS